MEVSLTVLFVLILYSIFSQWNSVLVQTAPELFQCRICQSPHVMGGDEAENHLATSHGTTIAPITCSTCGWSFAHIGRFASHHLLHMLKKPCHQCGINFANASERFAHLCDRHGLTKENGHLFK